MPKSVREAAMDFLAAREHSTQELTSKLSRRDYAEQEISQVLRDLGNEGLLSDERFTEAFIAFRVNRGSGPLKIQAELQQKGIAAELVAQFLDFRDPLWETQAVMVRNKKFGKGTPRDYKDKVRQARFLQYRGFTSEHIRKALQEEEVTC